MENKKNCLFCQIINKEKPSFKIYEDDKTYAFLDLYPVSDGHTLIVPKNHHENALDCSEDDLQAVALTSQKVAKILNKTLSPVGFNFISNNGRVAYQMIMHYHVHVLPKYKAGQGYLLSKETSQNILPEAVFKKITTIKK